MEAKSTTVWLARHGLRLDYVDEGWREHASRPFDCPLAPEGVEQAQALGKRLCGEKIQCIFASPWRRTMETASQVAEALDLPICIEPGAAEWLNHEWFDAVPSFSSPAEMAREFPHVDPGYSPAIPLDDLSIETPDEMSARAARAIRRLIAVGMSNFLVVGHQITIAAMGTELTSLLSSRVPETAIACLVGGADSWKVREDFSIHHLTAVKGTDRNCDPACL